MTAGIQVKSEGLGQGGGRGGDARSGLDVGCEGKRSQG